VTLWVALSGRDCDSVDGLIFNWREAAERWPVTGPFDPGDYRLLDARGPVDLPQSGPADSRQEND